MGTPGEGSAANVGTAASGTPPAVPDDAGTTNPASDGFPAVSVEMPQELTVTMVQANYLDDYEQWGYVTGFVLACASGLDIAAIVDTDRIGHSWSTNWTLDIVGSLFTFVLIVAIRIGYRKRIRLRGKLVPYKYTRAR